MERKKNIKWGKKKAEQKAETETKGEGGGHGKGRGIFSFCYYYGDIQIHPMTSMLQSFSLLKILSCAFSLCV